MPALAFQSGPNALDKLFAEFLHEDLEIPIDWALKRGRHEHDVIGPRVRPEVVEAQPAEERVPHDRSLNPAGREVVHRLQALAAPNLSPGAGIDAHSHRRERRMWISSARYRKTPGPRGAWPILDEAEPPR